MYLDVFYGKHVELPRREKKKKKKEERICSKYWDTQRTIKNIYNTLQDRKSTGERLKHFLKKKKKKKG